MTLFEQILIPLAVDTIKKEDLTSEAGFVDSYTIDPDHPAKKGELFLMYNADLRNEAVRHREIRMMNSKMLKKTYVKRINGKYYDIYSFVIFPAYMHLYYNNVGVLSDEQRSTVLQFWGSFSAVSDKIKKVNSFCLNYEHEMPLDDYRPTWVEVNDAFVTKKASISNEMSASFLSCLIGPL